MGIHRLILSISGSGQVKVLLTGTGKKRQRLLRGYEKFIETNIPDIDQKVKESLWGKINENTNFNFH